MIRSFAGEETERVWNGERSRKLPSDIQRTARRKLRQLTAAERLQDMAVPRQSARAIERDRPSTI